MRLMQFRRHLDGFAVRVSDPVDVQVLRSNPKFSEVAVLTDLRPDSGHSPLILSVEFYSAAFDVTSLDEWKAVVWDLLKYRKPRK